MKHHPPLNLDENLGRLLLRQTGMTLQRILIYLLPAVLALGLAVVVLLIDADGQVPIGLTVTLIVIGTLCLLAIPLGRVKAIELYENGVVVRKPFKSRTVLHKDVVAVQFLAVMKYNQGIYEGTTSHFTIIPMVDKTVNIRIHGSLKDSDRIGAIAQTILMRNPDARLEKIL